MLTKLVLCFPYPYIILADQSMHTVGQGYLYFTSLYVTPRLDIEFVFFFFFTLMILGSHSAPHRNHSKKYSCSQRYRGCQVCGKLRRTSLFSKLKFTVKCLIKHAHHLLSCSLICAQQMPPVLLLLYITSFSCNAFRSDQWHGFPWYYILWEELLHIYLWGCLNSLV